MSLRKSGSVAPLPATGVALPTASSTNCPWITNPRASADEDGECFGICYKMRQGRRELAFDCFGMVGAVTLGRRRHNEIFASLLIGTARNQQGVGRGERPDKIDAQPWRLRN